MGGVDKLLLEGKGIADRIMLELSSAARDMEEKSGSRPRLDLILVGDDQGARIYSQAKMKRGKKIGCDVTLTELPEDSSMKEVSSIIGEKSLDPDIHGIMIENPVPKNLSISELADLIPYYKDVDGTGSMNQGLIVSKKEFLVPATPAAVVEILTTFGINGTVTIVNRSPVVGRPLAGMLLNRDYTVTVCHSKTHDLKKYTISSDIIVTAVGHASYFDASYFSPESTVIDVGINYVDDKVVGDVKFDDVSKQVKNITPVPGGVGPITATLIFRNLITSFRYQFSKRQ